MPSVLRRTNFIVLCVLLLLVSAKAANGGACCYNSGLDCIDIPNDLGESFCISVFAGRWQGPDSLCDEVDCVIGACCVEDATAGLICTDALTVDQCTRVGGEYLGDGTLCENEQCIPSRLRGACCINNTMCYDDYDEASCIAEFGQFFGPGSTCGSEGVECNPGPAGACCFDSECWTLTFFECEKTGGIWSGGDCTECSCWPCGACCNGSSCQEEVTQDHCDFIGGQWYEQTSCLLEPCPVCAGDINGDFVVNTEDFSEFLVQFGQSGEGLSADLDGDQDVDIDDFSEFLINFGNTCFVN